MNAAPIFRRVALIGFGLIGGSIARAVRVQGLASEIVTTARSEKTRARVAARRPQSEAAVSTSATPSAGTALASRRVRWLRVGAFTVPP